jgi:hypothetical protein
MSQYFNSLKKLVNMWQNYDFYVKVPIEQSFDKTFFFFGCYKVVQKKCTKVQFFTMGILNKAQWFEILPWGHIFKIIIYLFKR